MVPTGRCDGGLAVPYRVCFVCTGNICRSPMAEVVLRARLEEAGLAHAVSVDSAGTGTWHVGEGMDRSAAAALRRSGYADHGHVARHFDGTWLVDLDVAVALDHSHLRVLEAAARRGGHAELRLLRSFDPTVPSGRHGDGLDVPDPWGGSDREFDECLAMIESACGALADELARRVGAGRGTG